MIRSHCAVDILAPGLAAAPCPGAPAWRLKDQTSGLEIEVCEQHYRQLYERRPHWLPVWRAPQPVERRDP